jgi:hypothetical protein
MYIITWTGIAINLDILPFTLDVEPLPDKGFRPRELHNGKQNRTNFIRNTEKLAGRRKNETPDRSECTHLALLVALLPHCLIIARRTDQNKNPHPSLLCSPVGAASYLSAPKLGNARGNIKSGTNLPPSPDFDPCAANPGTSQAAEQEQCGSLPQPNARKGSILRLRVNKQGAKKSSAREQWRKRERERECYAQQQRCGAQTSLPEILNLNGLRR